jgi:prevent-host-death family protein
MNTVTVQDAKARLEEIIDRLHPGEEIVITRDNRPVATLTGSANPQARSRQLGTLKGTVKYMAPDFDAPLDEFKDYTG